MRTEVSRFVAGCHVCQTVKPSTEKPAGFMAPLPVPQRRFGDWSMDFVVELPEVDGFNAMFVCVDRLSKLVRVCPCRVGEGNLSAPETA